MGMKHKRVEEALRNHGDEASIELPKKSSNAADSSEGTETETKPVETLQGLLSNCKSSEPALGLEHIYEYHPENGAQCIYECRMCNCTTGLSNIFMHIFGNKHRIAYLSKYHPIMGIASNYQLKNATKIKKLKNSCDAIEKTFGRKKINILKGDYAPRNSSQCPIPRPSINYRPNSILQQMDFTKDDFDSDSKPKINMQAPPALPECEVSFRELKAKHETRMKNMQEGNNPSKEPGEAGYDSDRDVVSMDLSECDPDEFLCNQELFDFLEKFKILNENDVQFISKVTEIFGSALLKYVIQDEAQKQTDSSKMVANKTTGQLLGHSAASANKKTDSASNYSYSQQSTTSKFNEKGSIGQRHPEKSQSRWSSQMQNQKFPINEKASGSTLASGQEDFNPAFPDNETTAKFFDSIKNTDISEVIATLNRITTTNPAFKGVHVPTLIKHLGDTGKLKSQNENRKFQK